MIKGIFVNLSSHYPVCELHAAQKDELDENSRIYILGDDYKYNGANPFGRNSINNYSRARALGVAKFLKIQPTYVPYSENCDLPIEAFQKIENSVMSSIASLTRTSSRFELEAPWDEVYLNWLNCGQSIYSFFEKEFANGLDSLYMYNGRFYEDASARAAATFTNKNFKVYDFKKAGTYYEFYNTPLHAIDANYKKAMDFYIANPKKARETANEFIESKINGIATYERSYTELQQKNKITIPIDNSKKIISIFPSSDDEYRFLSGDWGAPVVNSQVDEIFDFISSLDPKKYQCVIRMHPNMKSLKKELLDSYKKLEKLTSHCFVLDPYDSTSTYTLIEESDVVMCFCSMVSVEANYLRKPVINIGGAPYYKLPIAHFVKNGRDAAAVINSNKISIKPKRSSIIWMYYMWKYSDKNPYIYPADEIMPKRGEEFSISIPQPHLLRLLAGPARTEIQLRLPVKKNINFYLGLFKSFLDTVFNKFSIKS